MPIRAPGHNHFRLDDDGVGPEDEGADADRREDDARGDRAEIGPPAHGTVGAAGGSGASGWAGTSGRSGRSGAPVDRTRPERSTIDLAEAELEVEDQFARALGPVLDDRDRRVDALVRLAEHGQLAELGRRLDDRRSTSRGTSTRELAEPEVGVDLDVVPRSEVDIGQVDGQLPDAELVGVLDLATVVG